MSTWQAGDFDHVAALMEAFEPSVSPSDNWRGVVGPNLDLGDLAQPVGSPEQPVCFLIWRTEAEELELPMEGDPVRRGVLVVVVYIEKFGGEGRARGTDGVLDLLLSYLGGDTARITWLTAEATPLNSGLDPSGTWWTCGMRIPWIVA